MMLIKDYENSNITENFLQSNNWDLIELNKSVDIVKLQEWYSYIEKNYNYLKFNFKVNLNLLSVHAQGIFNTDSLGSTFNVDRNEISGLSSYTLKWIVEKDIPLPPPWAVNLDIFSELKSYYNNDLKVIDIDYDNYYSKCNFLKQYYFGEFKNIFQLIENKIYNPRITIHSPNFNLNPHTDKAYIGRLHIPIINKDSLFCWGENLEREYKLELGKIYIINSKITHGTKNGNDFRVNLMADIAPGREMDLINL